MTKLSILSTINVYKVFLWQKNLRDQPKIDKVDHQNIGLSSKMPEKDERPEKDSLSDGSIL